MSTSSSVAVRGSKISIGDVRSPLVFGDVDGFSGSEVLQSLPIVADKEFRCSLAPFKSVLRSEPRSSNFPEALSA